MNKQNNTAAHVISVLVFFLLCVAGDKFLSIKNPSPWVGIPLVIFYLLVSGFTARFFCRR